ncbi:MAG: hypothetical protein K6E29_09610 [Cyanobacteria bacterium RUI128]|nr:hypothetical protein [Cyanobacteria bacterium RUI128]
MGLSSSQARLLTLTARMHQIEYKAAKLEAMKLQMANESRRVYDEYLEALDKTKVQVKKLNSVGAATYEDISSYATLTNAGYKLYQIGEDGELTAVTSGTGSFTIAGQSVNITTFNTEVLTNLLNSGWFILKKIDVASGADLYETSVAVDTGLQEVSDETLLRKAEAKYEADMRKIDAKDRKYDTDLAALDTERNAIKSEMETLKTVAKDNVERTFKLFS